jgi:hypothetical protein
MKYYCKVCEYKTELKADYEKHLFTLKHKNNIKKQYKCPECNTFLNARSTYYSHLKKCNLDNSNKDLKIQLLVANHEIETLKLKNECEKVKNECEKEKVKILKSVVKNSNSTTKTALKISSKSISAIKYVNENFKNAPKLETLTDFNMMGYNIEDKIEKKKLVDNLLYHYRQNSVHKIFGDHIVSLYKKDNLENQSMHTTDTSRMNYIVRGSKNGNNLKWYIDKNGVMVCDIIIEKLISYFVDVLKWYQTSLINDMLEEPNNIQLDTKNKVENILGMLINVDSGQLIKDTNKYIAPFFNLDK